MLKVDPKLQYYLSIDMSKYGIGGALFQLYSMPLGTEAGLQHHANEWIIMFISFRLADAETHYGTTDQKALAAVRCLAEVRWLVIGSPYPVKLYTDHQSLLSILSRGADASSRIVQWQDRLNEYDLEVHHQLGKSHLMGIVDGLSKMPTRYTTVPKAMDSK